MKNNKNTNLFLFSTAFLINFILASITAINNAYAQNVSEIGENIADSASTLPDLINGGAYIVAAIIGALGLLKLKNHIDAPQQVELKVPVIHFLVSGMLFAIPYIYGVLQGTVNPDLEDFDPTGGPLYTIFQGLAVLGRAPLQNVNHVLGSILISIEDLPNLISAVFLSSRARHWDQCYL